MSVQTYDVLCKEVFNSLDKLIEFVKHAPVESGVCCCGDSMREHPDPMWCGHTPVDTWDHNVSCYVEEHEKLRAKLHALRIL
jgi:hypothetical protein